MKEYVNDLRVATAYKKQFSDKFNLKDNDVLIDVQTNWVKFEVEFELDGHKFHPYIRYENKNVNTPRIMDIDLYWKGSQFDSLPYKSKYVESAKVSEVSIYNPIEMCKNMAFEMMTIWSNASTWIHDRKERHYDLGGIVDKKKFWKVYCYEGKLSKDGFGKGNMIFDSDEFNSLLSNANCLIGLLNTITYTLCPGRFEQEEVTIEHLTKILNGIAAKVPELSLFDYGEVAATFGYYLADRFEINEERDENFSLVPHGWIKMDKQFYYTLEMIYLMIKRVK